ncbi:MAG: hypothetical protein GF334_09255 [Candidatus Altiarchaeales archaeon]|nr:hypothetical protein [Candidatus Altiarchaeales archaeon]
MKHPIIDKWIKNGRRIPAPGEYKIQEILEYAQKYHISTFIETGTHIGSTLNGVRGHFQRAYSIELNAKLYEHNIKRFDKYNNIYIFHGESEKVLPNILSKINEPCLFWLDAHYSGGNTCRGATDSALHAELPIILEHQIKNHVILIDDTYHMVDQNGYISVETATNMVKQSLPEYNTKVDGYIFRATPPLEEK